MVKKLLFVMILIAILSLAFAAPAFADQPQSPGGFGEHVFGLAQDENGPGFSPEVKAGMEMAETMGKSFGQFIHGSVLDEFDIPPRHTP